ncbi:MAG: murein biosynthesis integral membrane protein MurJ [Anaerolineae bacterium]
MIESTDVDLATPTPGQPLADGERRGIAKAAIILAFGNITSRILGLAREIVKANLFGASGLLSAFNVAAYVPTSLFDLIVGGMVSSSLVPVFSDYAAEERRETLWQVVSTVLSVATAVLLVVVMLVELFASQVAWLVGANEFTDPALTAGSIHLMRLVTPAVLFLGLSSILTGALYALKRFTMPAFISATFNGTIVIVAIVRPREITSLAWGVLIGSVLQVLLQLPALRDARIRWQFNWQHPAIRRILRLYAPIVAGLVVNQLAVALSLKLATSTGDQSVSYMKFATTLTQFPLGLVVTALSIATLPTLSRQALGRLDAFKGTLAEGLRLVITLILPATTGLFALAVPIVALLFEHGAFTPADTQTTALVLRVYLFGLPFAAVDQMLVFASYARKDTWRPAAVGVISILIYTAVAVALLQPLGLLSLMIADATKHVVHTLMMLWLLKRHLGGLAGYHVAAAVIKSLIAAVVTGAAAYGASMMVVQWVTPAGLLSRLLVVASSGAAGLAVYVVSVAVLDIRDAKSLPQTLRRRKKA